jgi:hypothetical protein
MDYSLDPVEVKKVIDLKLAGKEYNEEQFKFYHLHRNHFNIKNEITSLTAIGSDKFLDNKNNIWREEPTMKNLYHMSTWEWVKGMGGAKKYSRKFLRDDNSIIGGEFEIIVRYDSKRIDALTEPQYQETYNFGKTKGLFDSTAHVKLDVDPHKNLKNYVSVGNTGFVKIIDLPD